MAELEHVVWPTHIETKKFFQAVVSIIAGMALFTYLITLIFSNGIFGLRTLIHAPKTADLSGSPVASAEANIGINPIEVTTEWGKKVQVTPVAVPKK